MDSSLGLAAAVQSFGTKKSVFDKYQDFESNYLKGANQAILQDEGVPTVMKDLQKEFFHLLQGALVVSMDDLPPEVKNDFGHDILKGGDDAPATCFGVPERTAGVSIRSRLATSPRLGPY